MTTLMSDSIDLMIVGMGFVFVFLMLLVAVTSLMSRVAGRFEPEPVEQPAPARADLNVKAPDYTDDQANQQLVAVITAAVSRYRK